MSKQAVAPKPPHSLELRAKRMTMPSSAGVHIPSVESTSSEPVANNDVQASEENEVSPRLAAIHAAIARVDVNDQNAWTKNGGPKVSTLEKLLGYQITEAERDAAWHLEIGE